MMTDTDKKIAIKQLHEQLSNNQQYGFDARARLLYLAFLKGRKHEQLEPSVTQNTFDSAKPLATLIEAALEARIQGVELHDPDFAAWCEGLESRVRPPYGKRPRKDKGANRAAE